MRETKEARFDLRGDAQRKQVILRAAKVKNQSLSQFMIDTAYAEAENVLADRRQFIIEDALWARFCKALDSKPKPVSKLKNLLNSDSIFDKK